MFLLVKHCRIARAVVHPCLARNNHIPLQAAQHRAADHRGPRVHGLHDLDGPELAGPALAERVRRPFAVRWRGGAREVGLEAPVEVVRLAEAADEDDARDDATLGTEAIDLALDEIADLLHDGLEDVFDLGGCHD